jgi:hypothetical protein
VIPHLEKALAGNPALESRRRLEDIRDRLTPAVLAGNELRTIRGIEILERIGTNEAQRFLQSLAEGADGDFVTETAKTTLLRWKR